VNKQLKNNARAAIRLWVHGDPDNSLQENPLAARHRFTEQAGADNGKYTVRATQTRQSGGSRPVTTQMNSLELVRIRRIMEMLNEHDHWVVGVLRDWGKGYTLEEIANKRSTGAKYSKTRASEDLNIGLSLVALCLSLNEQGNLQVGGLIRSNRM